MLNYSLRKKVLRSAVGKTHVLRSGLVMDYTTSCFPLFVLGYPLDSRCLCFLAIGVAWSILTNHRPRYVTQGIHLLVFGTFQFLPTGLHGLCLGCCFSGLLPLRSLANGPLIGVRFRECLVVRLHSEIDQIHLSIEAQCVTTLLPLGDCHTWFFLFLNTEHSIILGHYLLYE